MRRVLIVVGLMALGAGGFVAALSGGAGHTATARLAAAVRPVAAHSPAGTRHRPRLRQAPTVPAQSSLGTSCFVGETSCSLIPCGGAAVAPPATVSTSSSVASVRRAVAVSSAAAARSRRMCDGVERPEIAVRVSKLHSSVQVPSPADLTATLPRLQRSLGRRLALSGRRAPAARR